MAGVFKRAIVFAAKNNIDERWNYETPSEAMWLRNTTVSYILQLLLCNVVSLRMCKYWCTHLTGSEQRTECHNIVNTTCRLAPVESQTSLSGRVSVSCPSIRGISIGYKLLARESWKRIALLNHLKQTSPVLALEKAGYPLTYRTKVQSIVFLHLDWYFSVYRFIKQIKKIKYHCKEIRSINGYFVSIKLKPVVNTY